MSNHSKETVEEITLHMTGDGQFNIVCPLCGVGKVINPPAHVTSIKISHCGKKFRLKLNRRKGLRKKCDNDSGIIKRGKERTSIKIKDLSLGGISFETKVSLSLGDMVELVAFFLVVGDLKNPIQLEIVGKEGCLYRAKFHGLQDGYKSKKAIYTWLH